MHDESTQPKMVSVEALEKGAERMLWMILLDDPGFWHLDEIKLQVQDTSRLEIEDAANRLAAHGLVHRIEDFVFPTRAALRTQRYEP
jgi:hypothetical protein